MGASAMLARLTMREVQYLLLLVCEAAWIYPWTLAIRAWWYKTSEPILDLDALLAVLLLAVTATRVATAIAGRLYRRGGAEGVELPPDASVRSRLRRVTAYLVTESVVVLGMAVAVLLALAELPASTVEGGPSAVLDQTFNGSAGASAALVLVLAGLLWWRGLRLGRGRPTLAVVMDEFLAGILALVILLALAPLAEQAFPMSTQPFTVAALAFTTASLAGIPLARLVDVSGRARYRGESQVAPGGCWLLTLAGIVAAVLLLALFLAQLFTFATIGAFWGAIKDPVVGALTLIVYILAQPFEILARVLAFLASLIPRSGTTKPRTPAPTTDWMANVGQGDELAVAPELLLALKLALALMVVVGLSWLLVRAVSRVGRRSPEDGINEARDSVWSWPRPSAIWRWLLGLWRPLGARVTAMVSGRQGEREHGGSIKELYAEFLLMARELGHGRLPPETPLEYEKRLLEAVTAGAGDVGTITAAYVEERYAPPPIMPRDAGAAGAALSRLRGLWLDTETEREGRGP